MAIYEEFTPMLEDVVAITISSLFGDKNAIGIVLKGEDEMTLQLLTIVLSSSKILGKFTSASWIRYFQ